MKDQVMFETVVYKSFSATYHYTAGDDYIYLTFVDRPTTIKYRINSERGQYLFDLAKRKGYVKATAVNNQKTTYRTAQKQLWLFDR